MEQKNKLFLNMNMKRKMTIWKRFSCVKAPTKVVLLIFSAVFCFLAFFLYKSINVLLSVFPLDNPEALVFTLTHNIDGAHNVVWTLLRPTAEISVEYTLIILLLIGLVVLGLSAVLRCKKRQPCDAKINLFELVSLSFRPYFISVCVTGFVFVWLAFFSFPVNEFIDAYGSIVFGWQKENVLFDSDYVDPDSVQISFEEKRNLILIILESMEYNFQDSANGGNVSQNLIPELTDLMKKNVSFGPSGITTKGIGWTMGETIAKTCGLPLFQPLDRNEYGFKNFLKNAVCLTDLLNRNGYTFALAQGTEIKFGSMDFFLSSHNVSEENIFDLSYFEKKGAVRSNAWFFVSVPDRIVYDGARDIITELSNQSKPWAFMFYTIDTHGPYGRLDSSCVDQRTANLKMETQYPEVLRCASKQLDAFLKWASMQPWFANTTFAIMGDHPAMVAPEVIGFPKEKFEHYWLHFFINSALPQPEKKHQFTSYDIYPTILEAMGASIEGRALGLGRSLFSVQETLIEKYGKDSLNKMISRRGDAHNHFWH